VTETGPTTSPPQETTLPDPDEQDREPEGDDTEELDFEEFQQMLDTEDLTEDLTEEEAEEGRLLGESDRHRRRPGLRRMSRENALPEAEPCGARCCKAGVPEVSIELVEGRPARATEWNNQFVVTDMAHHTASRYSPNNLTPCLSLVKKGRSDLPGPLCNGYGGWDLCARIITLGYANHPGQGGPLTVPSGVKKPPSYTIPKDSARKYAFGWEFEGGIRDADWDIVLTNPRNGKKMTFREFMARCLNGTQDQYNLPLDAHTEHKTWAPTRKIDRLNYTRTRAKHEMTKWKVAAKATPAPAPKTPTDSHTVRIVSANIKDNPDMADRLVRADVREVRELGGWVLFQEIGERADHLALSEVLGPDWDVHFPTWPSRSRSRTSGRSRPRAR
jgi:hypothetical protein